jgi:hypothetical protein
MRSIAADAARAIRVLHKGDSLIETLPAGAREQSASTDRLGTQDVAAVVLAAFPAEAWIFVAELWRRGQTPRIFAATPLAAETPPPEIRVASQLQDVRVLLRPSFLNSVGGRRFSSRATARLGLPPSRSTTLLLTALEVARQLPDNDGPPPPQTTQGPPSMASSSQAKRRFQTSIGPIMFDTAGHSDLPRWAAHRFAEDGLVED